MADNEYYKSVPLQSDSDEYKKVEKAFNDTIRSGKRIKQVRDKLRNVVHSATSQSSDYGHTRQVVCLDMDDQNISYHGEVLLLTLLEFIPTTHRNKV